MKINGNAHKNFYQKKRGKLLEKFGWIVKTFMIFRWIVKILTVL